MSAESSISENIEEDISAEVEKNESANEETQIHNSHGEGLDNFAKTQSAVLESEELATGQNDDKESLPEHKESTTKDGNKKRAHEDEIVLHSNDTKRQAIEKFCFDEAEKIIKEAILIKHVLDEDKSQFDTHNKVEIDQITGERRQGEGYDRYLIDKLLHSEPDPSEETFEQIEGLDAGVRNGKNPDENLLDGTEEEQDGENFDMSGTDQG